MINLSGRRQDPTLRRLSLLAVSSWAIAACGARSGLIFDYDGPYREGDAADSSVTDGDSSVNSIADDSTDALRADGSPVVDSTVSEMPDVVAPDRGISSMDGGIADAAFEAESSSCAALNDASSSTDAQCSLGILIDQSASMNRIRSGSGRRRCEDEVLYAATVFNFLRCGRDAIDAGTCPNGTTSSRAIDLNVCQLYDASPSPCDLGSFYGESIFGCDTVSAKRVNVWTFNSATGLRSATMGITTDPQGWVNLSNNCNADTVLDTIRSLGAHCADDTPLADALCGVNDLVPAIPACEPPISSIFCGQLVVLTDGSENASTGACSGPDDPKGGPPSQANSWQARTYDRLGRPYGWVVDATLFLPAQSASTIDPETDAATSPSKSVAFFKSLSNITYGSFIQLTDDAPLSPLISK